MPRCLSRIRWLIGAALVLAGCATAAPTAPPPGPVRTGGQPLIRIGLAVGTADATIDAGGRSRVLADGRAIFSLTTHDRIVVASGAGGVRIAGSNDGAWRSIRIVPHSENVTLLYNGTAYRGSLEVVANSGGVTVINHLGIEEYLHGVVVRELGPRPADEAAALESQAVVSRTYALKNLGRFGNLGFDLMGSVADQAYGGVSAESEPGRRAVDATRGQVLTYNGELVAAFFHSTCGPSTASPEESFRSVITAPYLRPVSDRDGDGDYYGEMSPHFAWTVEWDGETLLDILRQTVPTTLGVEASVVDVVHDVWVERRGPSGRAMEVRIRVGTGEIPVFAPDVRAVFQTPNGTPMRSTAVTFEAEHDGDRVSRLIAKGTGWGHGLGMCQWGAIGRARAGQDYRQIVTTYFPGTRLERWY